MPVAAGSAKPEAPHGGAEHAERLPRRQAHEQLRTVGRRLLEDDRVVREPIGDRGEDVPGAERRAGPRGLQGLGALERLRRRGLSCGHGARERRAHRPRRGEHREVGRAAMHLGRVLADHDDRGAGLDERPRREGVLPERRRADRDHEVVRLERLAEARPVGSEMPREQPVILREPRPSAERLLPDGARQALRERDHGRPRVRVVDPGTGDERRKRGTLDELGELCHDGGVDRPGRAPPAAALPVPRRASPRRPSRPSAR